METVDWVSYVREALIGSAEVKRKVATGGSALIVEVAERLRDCLRRGGQVLRCGNRGSAADAQHLACELVSRLQIQRRALPAIALTTNTAGSNFDL